MSKPLIEFKKFLKQNMENLSEYEKKLSRIIIDNFSNIESTGSHSGKRGKLIARLIPTYDQIQDFEIDFESPIRKLSERQVQRLSKLIVKNFRGFSDEQIINFKNPYTFVYGPNGTGKSSLCEALEYSLVGSIHEAESKRISIRNYIKNVDTGKEETPVLFGINSLGEEVEVMPNPQTNEFYFIERNRIDGFARVSANTAQAQQQRLATLFGLEDFNSFVMNFNSSLDSYHECQGENETHLLEQQKQIIGYQKLLESEPEKKAEINQRRDTLIKKFSSIQTLEELQEKLKEKYQSNSFEIASLEMLKQKQDPGIDKFKEDIAQLHNLGKQKFDMREELIRYKDELSLKDLYTAIIQNEDKFSDICPACESKIYDDENLIVPKDPYANAKKKVEEFQKAIILENHILKVDKEIDQNTRSLDTQFPQLISLGQTINFPDMQILSSLKEQFDINKEVNENLGDAIATMLYHMNIFTNLKDYLNKYNKTVSETEEKIHALKLNNEKLQDFLKEVSKINLNYETLEKDREQAIIAIKNFDEENKELMEKVKQEKLIMDRNQKYNKAYLSLKKRLDEYNQQLPAKLTAQLNTKALDFYNAINKYDHPCDLLKKLKLPDSAGKKIIIQYKDGKDLDALHVLSEGHIRCLGLSILLAKNVQEGLPILIFDDVVNAIDDEHRKGVIETILGDDDIKEKQLIITTHGEEFLKQLENNIPRAKYNKTVTRIDFLKTDESKKILIKLDQPRNYLILAQKRLDEGQVRECLANSRRALENLTNTLWKRLSKHYNINLSVSMRSPGKPPELMSIVQALNKQLSKDTIEKFNEISPLLDTILAKNQMHSLEWSYLNKGTHDEDREQEFDRYVVKEILSLLNEIDTLINK